MYIESEPIPYQPFEGTQATLVETPEALEQMLEELKGAKEIAIDLEHHDSRSYIGLVSLMQISTRHKDWIIDTLKPWRRKLEVLNEVFTDPNILKVLHGSYMDNIWLQRDFGLYLVGVFDTFHAATALGYSGRSLAFLLMRFINFQAQKQYQTADWRMRPLPRELFDYARSDTHFLLYIYDCMRNELIRMSSSLAPEQSKIRYVLDNSKQYCLQQYENPFYDVTYGGGHSGWYKLLDRTPSIFSREQFSIFRAVHQWRDELARKLDESTGYILTNYSLFNLAKTIPKDEAGLFSAIQPISSPVRARKNELLGLIAKANIDGRDGPAMADVFEWLQPRQDDAPKLPAPTSSSAPTLPAPDANSNNSNTISFSSEGLQSLRSNTSHFWGGILNAPNWDQRRNFATESIRLALPLPKLTAEIFKDPAVDSHMDHNSPQAPKDPGVVAEVPHRRAKERESIAEANNTSSTNEVFILRQSGGKRKRGHNSSVADPEAPLNYDDEEQAGADQADTLALPGEETSPARKPAWRKEQARGRKAMRKAEKQASQETLRMAEGGGDGPSRAAAESELFDYDNAPSVLHAQTGEKAGKGKKGFNPYAKAADAPKGLGRAQKEKAGRSGTFTS
ncbi:MAG: exosome nuclease subunit [Bathelium mastoideum]|nr:MAG: exosome nuclease subunit [Bathelium mastoideum]